MKHKWLLIALFNFFLAASFGALLRFAFVEELSWIKYKNLLHGHSHVAMLGWIYMALYALLIHAFGPKDPARLSKYNLLFWITELLVLGMLVTFPIQGYAPASIAFSTGHIIASYVFVWWLWKDLSGQKGFARQMLKTAIVFMLLSTIGIWIIGPIMATGFRQSVFFYMAVQFYLHFQFNGWFTFAILALFFKMVENRSIILPEFKRQLFYYFLVISCILTYALAVVWSTRINSVLIANSIGVILQTIALLLFLQLIWPKRKEVLSGFQSIQKALLIIAFASLGLKIVMQTLVAIPFVAEAAYTIRNYIIGFIHLILLGSITMFIFSFSIKEKVLTEQNKLAFWGLMTIITGFLLSELLLFGQGTMLWTALGFLPFYYEILFGVSALIPVGILLFLMGQAFHVKVGRG